MYEWKCLYQVIAGWQAVESEAENNAIKRIFLKLGSHENTPKSVSGLSSIQENTILQRIFQMYTIQYSVLVWLITRPMPLFSPNAGYIVPYMQ